MRELNSGPPDMAHQLCPLPSFLRSFSLSLAPASVTPTVPLTWLRRLARSPHATPLPRPPCQPPGSSGAPLTCEAET